MTFTVLEEETAPDAREPVAVVDGHPLGYSDPVHAVIAWHLSRPSLLLLEFGRCNRHHLHQVHRQHVVLST